MFLQIESDIDDGIDRDPELKRHARLICSIPGCGPRLVAQFLAYIGDLRRFKTAKALAAFIGVTPKQRTSGTSIRGRTTPTLTAKAKECFMAILRQASIKACSL